MTDEIWTSHAQPASEVDSARRLLLTILLKFRSSVTTEDDAATRADVALCWTRGACSEISEDVSIARNGIGVVKTRIVILLTILEIA